MSHAITFDTLAFVKKLEASGIEAKKSEAITEALADVFESSLATVATKKDLDALAVATKKDLDALAVATKKDLDSLEMKLETKIDKTALEFDGKLSKLKSEIITWAVGLIFAQTAILSMIKFMH